MAGMIKSDLFHITPTNLGKRAILEPQNIYQGHTFDPDDKAIDKAVCFAPSVEQCALSLGLDWAEDGRKKKFYVYQPVRAIDVYVPTPEQEDLYYEDVERVGEVRSNIPVEVKRVGAIRINSDHHHDWKFIEDF